MAKKKKVVPVSVPAKPAKKPAKKGKPKNVVSSLQQARERLAEVSAEKARLEDLLAAFAALGGGSVKTKKSKRTSGTARVGSLELVYREVLAENPKGLTIEDACSKVQEAGYKTNSGNFAAVMGQLVHKLMNKDELVVADRDGRKCVYALKEAA